MPSIITDNNREGDFFDSGTGLRSDWLYTKPKLPLLFPVSNPGAEDLFASHQTDINGDGQKELVIGQTVQDGSRNRPALAIQLSNGKQVDWDPGPVDLDGKKTRAGARNSQFELENGKSIEDGPDWEGNRIVARSPGNHAVKWTCPLPDGVGPWSVNRILEGPVVLTSGGVVVGIDMESGRPRPSFMALRGDPYDGPTRGVRVGVRPTTVSDRIVFRD